MLPSGLEVKMLTQNMKSITIDCGKASALLIKYNIGDKHHE
jgi:hypothetical protein